MSDIINTIRREIEDDFTINASVLNFEVEKKGFIPRRTIIRVLGSVENQNSKSKIEQICTHHAGNNYTVVNDLQVR